MKSVHTPLFMSQLLANPEALYATRDIPRSSGLRLGHGSVVISVRKCEALKELFLRKRRNAERIAFR